MGCPDAVRAGLLALPGVFQADYDAARDRFTVRYDDERLGLEAMFAAIFQAGRTMGQDYLPEVVG